MRLIFCLLALLIVPTLAEDYGWHEIMSGLNKELFALERDESDIKDQLKIVEEQAEIQGEHLALLKSRLASLNEKLDPSPLNPATSETGHNATPEATPAGETPLNLQKENEMIARCANRMIVLLGNNKQGRTAFLAAQDGRTRIFASAPWVDENPKLSVTDWDGSPVAIGQKTSCPIGVDLVCLQPEATDLPHFELADDAESMDVGARIVVLIVDPETKRVKGIGGAIRGIGPDTLELDAMLTPEMSGAPVVSLGSGKVIGIVAIPRLPGWRTNGPLEPGTKVAGTSPAASIGPC